MVFAGMKGHSLALATAVSAALGATACAMDFRSPAEIALERREKREHLDGLEREIDQLRTNQQETVQLRREVDRLRASQREVLRLKREKVQLRREVDRLRADLRDAEGALIALESGLKGLHTRADAVSAVADARILVERAAAEAPWGAASLMEAREKLEEADRQVRSGHFGSATVFISRARRIAESLLEEASERAKGRDVLYVTGARVNVRSGPSTAHTIVEVLKRKVRVTVEERRPEWVQVRTPAGSIGWVHASLLQDGR
jgi:TolA-binding protein